MSLKLDPRPGDRPITTSPAIPHKQRSQNAPRELQEALWERMIGLDHVRAGSSPISGPLTRAMHLEAGFANGPETAYAPDGNRSEFGHIHDSSDGSLHVTLSTEDARTVVDAGWGEWHPTVLMRLFPPNLVMVYGPRDEFEIAIIMEIVQRSYDNARGE